MSLLPASATLEYAPPAGGGRSVFTKVNPTQPEYMESDTQTRRTFEYTSDVRINYEVHGDGGQPALLIHGFGASLENWRDIQPRLEPHLRMYLIDLKGFGLSSKPQDGCYSVEDQASVITSFIERQELTGVTLIGHSLGGAVAVMTYLKLAATHSPGRIRSLILIDSPATVQRLPFFVAALRVPLLRYFVRLAPPRSIVRYVLRRISCNRRKITGKLVQRYAQFLKLPGSYRAMIATARQILPKDPTQISAGLGSIHAPTLIIQGERDRVIYRWQADLFKKLIPNSKLVVMPRCGHLPAEEWPEETAGEILSFLAGQPRVLLDSPPRPCE